MTSNIWKRGKEGWSAYILSLALLAITDTRITSQGATKLFLIDWAKIYTSLGNQSQGRGEERTFASPLICFSLVYLCVRSKTGAKYDTVLSCKPLSSPPSLISYPGYIILGLCPLVWIALRINFQFNKLCGKYILVNLFWYIFGVLEIFPSQSGTEFWFTP